MIETMTAIADLTLDIALETHVRASLETTFAALLEQLGPGNETLEGKPLHLVIEARPGGRWYRDLGADNGHLWGHVQAIKRPTLFEITGPLMMSLAVVSNVQYRLSEADGGTLVKFRHQALGLVPADMREGMAEGWTVILERIRRQAEGRKKA